MPPADADPSRLDIYAKVKLTADLSHLSDNQRQMIGLLIDAGKITDDIFWKQVWGDRESLLADIEDEKIKRFARYNYGPWDRLAEDKPFISQYGARPPRGTFLP